MLKSKYTRFEVLVKDVAPGNDIFYEDKDHSNSWDKVAYFANHVPAINLAKAYKYLGYPVVVSDKKADKKADKANRVIWK